MGKQTVVLRTIGQHNVGLSPDERVLGRDIEVLWENGQKVLYEIGKEVARELGASRPSDLEDQNSPPSSGVKVVFRVGNCLVENHIFDYSNHTNHEFNILGVEEEVEKIAETLSSRIERPVCSLENCNAGRWNKAEKFEVDKEFSASNFESVRQFRDSIKIPSPATLEKEPR
jgi:predicted hydrocarbon binding protein